jgi:glycosyltransferase involved in cell wall biosynthesis
MIEGIEVIHPRYLLIPRLMRALYGLFLFISLLKQAILQLKKIKFDVIFATWAYPDGFAAALIAKLLKKPLIIKVHGTDINEFTQYYLRRTMIIYALSQADKVIAVSKALKQKIITLGIPESHIEVIFNGIDTNKFKPLSQIRIREKLNLPLDKRIVLFVGYLKPVKGLNYLLDAFSLLVSKKNAPLSLFIVGEGESKQNLLVQVKERDIADSVEFVGAKPHEEIPLWMNACDVFCLPSLNEGLPNVVLEALACGKPVVATNVGGIPEIIENGECGLLVPPGNSTELANAIYAVINKSFNSPKLRSRVIPRSWEINAQKIYTQLVKATRSNF